MDEITIDITEITEAVIIEGSTIVEDVNITISEVYANEVEVFEIVENVSIDITDIMEEVLIEVSEGGLGGDITIPYKIWSMPSAVDGGGKIIAYCGFSQDLEALTSEAKWAVKKLLEDGTETWAGKNTFDQILDDYLTLIYS